MASVSLVLAFAMPAFADEEGVPPPPPDPLAAQRSADKAARIEAAAATHSGNDVFAAIIGRQRIDINTDSVGPDYAELTMPNWKEPQPSDPGMPFARNPQNWCGPGATSGVVSRWSYMYGRGDEVAAYPGGPGFYQNHVATDLNEVEWCYDPRDGTYKWCTTYSGMKTVTNTAAQAGTFYDISGPLTLSTFTNDLKLDLHDMGVPLMPVVMSGNLDGWLGYNVAHWIVVKQYWQGGNTSTYNDTAGYYQRATNYPYGPYGSYVHPIDWLYNQIQLADNTIVW